MSSIFRQMAEPDADILEAKSAIGLAIAKRIKARGLTQQQAAEALGISRSEVSRIMNAKLARFTIDRLVSALQSLDPSARVTVVIGANAVPGLLSENLPH